MHRSKASKVYFQQENPLAHGTLLEYVKKILAENTSHRDQLLITKQKMEKKQEQKKTPDKTSFNVIFLLIIMSVNEESQKLFPSYSKFSSPVLQSSVLQQRRVVINFGFSHPFPILCRVLGSVLCILYMQPLSSSTKTFSDDTQLNSSSPLA